VQGRGGGQHQGTQPVFSHLYVWTVTFFRNHAHLFRTIKLGGNKQINALWRNGIMEYLRSIIGNLTILIHFYLGKQQSWIPEWQPQKLTAKPRLCDHPARPLCRWSTFLPIKNHLSLVTLRSYLQWGWTLNSQASEGRAVC
jgi:hypothetical protein